MKYKGILKSVDQEVITPRTGKSEVNVVFNRLPKHLDYIPFLYDGEECESPGVMLATDNIEKSENGSYLFYDIEGRRFILSKVTENVD